MNEHSNPGSIFEKSPGFFNKKIETESFQCDFVGVYHNRRTIEKSGELLREIIAQTEILITELAVFSDASQDDGIEYFYSSITNFAREAKIKMIVPDPEKDIADALLNRSVDVLALGTAVGSTGYAFLLLNQLAALKKRNSARLKMNAVEISRRNFLKLGAATAVAIPSMLNATASLLNEAGTPLDQNLLLEDFLLSSIDYRNVCIAKAIFEVAKADSKITVLYGANHYEGVRHYLYDEVLLDERLGIYQKTFGMWSPDKAEEFDFS